MMVASGIVTLALLSYSGCCCNQVQQLPSGGCNGGSVPSQQPSMYGYPMDSMPVGYRESYRFRSNGYGYAPQLAPPVAFGYQMPSVTYAPQYNYGYDQAIPGYYGSPTPMYSQPYYGYPGMLPPQPYLQCGPGGCVIRYR